MVRCELDLGSCISFETLVLNNCPGVASLQLAAELPNFLNFVVKRCPAMRTVNLHSAANIEYLSVERCKNLETVQMTSDAPRLSRSYIERCPALVTVDARCCPTDSDESDYFILDKCGKATCI